MEQHEAISFGEMKEKVSGIAADVAEVKTALNEIRKEVKATNGSVAELKLWQAYIKGALAFVGLTLPVVAGVAVWALTTGS
jgi:hypothetical protein